MNLFTAAETTANYANAGAAKAKLPVSKMLLLGILAGFLIGFPCLLYTSPSPRDGLLSRMPSSA